jgi:hypothetical protein
MKLLLGSLHFALPGGAVTYLATIAEALQRLGHEITIHTSNPGMMADEARKGGLSVIHREEGLPGEFEGVLTHDPVMAYSLLGRFPDVPHVFVCHGGDTPPTFPPQLAGGVTAVVVMNDRVARHMEAMTLDVEIVRLHQPIDYERFRPVGAARECPREVLLLGNYLGGAKRDLVTRACELTGLRWKQLGGQAGIDPAPQRAISDADIVVGYGRSILEGMAGARAAYVLDFVGADGWVTPERYPHMESNGFAGTAFDRVPTTERVALDLKEYSVEMGTVNNTLVLAHHDPFEHVTELISLFERAGPRRTVALGPTEEMARLARLQWDAHWRAEYFARETHALHERLADAQRDRYHVQLELEQVKASRRWRAVQALANPLDALRGRRRPPHPGG